MKRWLFSLLLIIPLGLQAQVRLDQPEMYLGIHAGATGSMVNFSPSVPVQPFMALGTTAGVGWRYIAERHFGLQIELNYAQRGWKEQGGFRRQADYIQLPMMTHLYVGKKVRGYLNLGPQVAYLVAQRSWGTVTSAPQHALADNRFDYGFAGGLGMQFITKAGSYELDARFNYSMGNYFSSRKVDYFSASNHMNIAVTLSWMWAFNQNRH